MAGPIHASIIIDDSKIKTQEEADSEKKYKEEEADSETKKYKVLEEEKTAMKAEMRAMKNLDLSNLPPRGKIEEAESPPSRSHPRLHLKIVDPEIKEADSLPSESDLLPRPSESYKLYFFFWHVFSAVRYSLYEVDVPIPLPPPPSKAVQDDKIRNPRPLSPILQLKTGKYADDMCCVQLGSMLYFLGGEMKIKNPYIDEDVKKELAVRDLFPKDVYCFELANDHNYRELKAGTAMNSGKASPLAFVADENIYVIGSSRWDSDENFAYFEMFDPKVDSWIILPNPPPLIRNVNTIWLGHVVVGRKALITALLPHETEHLYCFDLDSHKWANTSIPDYLGNFSGDTQFVERRLYGCYYENIAALVPLEEEEEKEEEEEEEEEEEAEDKELQQFFKHHRLHQVSEEMGMDAIRNVPPQVQYSASLLHLGKMFFCYVRTGMPPHPHPKIASDFDIGDDKKRFISIVIFQAVRGTYKKNDTRLSKAIFLHSEHYEVNTPFPSDGFIKGCYVLGSVYFPCLLFVSSLLFFLFVSTYHMNTSVVF